MAPRDYCMHLFTFAITISVAVAVNVVYQGPFNVSTTGIVYGCPSLNKGVVLTFDDGPSVYTKYLLDTLDNLNISAVFFVTGSNAAKYPGLVRRMYNSGHVVGSHTYNHPNLGDLHNQGNHSEIARQINETETIIKNITGSRPYLFRPPYGSLNLELQRMLNQQQYTVVMWNAGNIDWFYKNVSFVAQEIDASIAEPGGITCWHDTIEDTAKNIQLFIDMYKSRIISFEHCVNVPI